MFKPSVLRLLPAVYFITLYAMQPVAAQSFQELCLGCVAMGGFLPPKANRKYPL